MIPGNILNSFFFFDLKVTLPSNYPAGNYMFTCLTLAIERLEQDVKYVQS